jgi:hypothetical protein
MIQTVSMDGSLFICRSLETLIRDNSVGTNDNLDVGWDLLGNGKAKMWHEEAIGDPKWDHARVGVRTADSKAATDSTEASILVDRRHRGSFVAPTVTKATDT